MRRIIYCVQCLTAALFTLQCARRLAYSDYDIVLDMN